VQRPVFYAIAIIITAYLPIFTLQAVEGRLFRPMAWTVAFALLGALTFSMIIAPVLSSLLFRAKAQRNGGIPVMEFLRDRYRKGVTWAIHHHRFTIGVRRVRADPRRLSGLQRRHRLRVPAPPGRGRVVGARHSGAERRTDGSIRVANEARILLCSFPETTECTSQTGRPDDGTDHTGFFNTEYFVGLKPKEQWRPVFHENKDDLIAAMNSGADKEDSRRRLGVLAADRRQHGRGGQRRKGRAGHQGLRKRLHARRQSE
jgi:heavy metal efflux system protein